MPAATLRPTRRMGVQAGLTGLAAGLSLGAHVLGGGETPGLLVSLALLVPTWLLARPLTTHSLRPSRVVAWLGALQLLWHGVLAWSEAGYAIPPTMGISALMFGAHVGAGAALALLARHLETTLAALAEAWHQLVTALLPGRLTYGALPGWAQTPAFAGPQICCPSDAPARSLRRRGPPA